MRDVRCFWKSKLRVCSLQCFCAAFDRASLSFFGWSGGECWGEGSALELFVDARAEPIVGNSQRRYHCGLGFRLNGLPSQKLSARSVRSAADETFAVSTRCQISRAFRKNRSASCWCPHFWYMRARRLVQLLLQPICGGFPADL